MTRNQLHGKKFEDFIKACGLFPGASDAGRGVTSGFDIEARFDRVRRLPTSVKASGNDSIALSDARRFFAIDFPFRMIVGRYRQQQQQKIFGQIHEFIVTEAALSALTGDLSLAMVTDFHNGLGLANFPKGQHVAARVWAAEQKILLSDLTTRIILNPKIDSKSQRRLQCSVRLMDLTETCQKLGEYILHSEAIGDYALPVIQNSARRTFGSA
jgi:hypothetical protein